MSRPAWSPRVVIALAAILLYAGLSTARWARRAAQWPARAGADEISAYEHRFDRLRPALPPTGVVGYVGHPDPNSPATPGASSPALVHFRRYLLAQYSLAPLLLVEDTTPDMVIGNFEPGTEAVPPTGFHRTGDFGNGVVLFRRGQP
jgi:hypothetical protein